MYKTDCMNTLHSLLLKCHNLDILAIALDFIYSVVVHYLLKDSTHAVEFLRNNFQF